MRTRYDLDMLREVGYCNGIENYSRHLTGREAGSTPWCLIDFFPQEDWLLFVDESHVTLPQVHGMYAGDRSRKLVLSEHGFRLPSALDNRPLTYDEFDDHIRQVVYVSATPGTYEIGRSSQVVEMIIRPTGLVDPEVEVRPTRNQVDDLMEEIRVRTERKERVLVTTLTKKMAEDLTDFLLENRGCASATCIARSTRSNASQYCAICGWASSTCWSASIFCARAWICLRFRSSVSWMPTRRAICAAGPR